MARQLHLHFQLAQLLRAAVEAHAVAVQPESEWYVAARAALEEFDRHGYQPDELLFQLRGLDILSPIAIKHYAARGYIARVNPAKLVGALEIAEGMESMTGRRLPG